MTESNVVDRSEMAAMRAELDRVKQLLQRGAITTPTAPGGVDELAASDFRRMTGPDLDVVPRSHPVGYLEGANWETRQRMKLEAVARSLGGRRDADRIVPSMYTNDWTQEEEHRWEFSLGLRSDPPEMPLDRPEKPGTQNAQHPRTAQEVQRAQGRRPAT
jgi:hypothetical protein